VTVVGIFAHADIGDHHQLRHRLFDGANRFLNDAVGRVSVGAERILGLGNAEEDHRRDAEGLDLLRLGDDMFDRLLVDPGIDGISFLIPAPKAENIG